VRPYYDPIVFNNMLDGIDRSKYLIATYYIEDTIPGVDFLDHFALIQQMILEGSTGTWAQVKEDTPEVRERLSGKLVGYYEVPAPEGVKRAVAQFAFSIDAWGGDVPMMLLSFAGNCFAYSPKLRLLDVCFPETLVKQFKGPKFGIEGTRKLLNVPKRPLILHIIKPKMGMTPEQTANQVYETAIGGADMAKDDEMTSETYNCKFEDRLKAVMAAIDKAEKKTGKRVIYFVSITDEVNRIHEKARKAVRAGANGLLLCYSAGPSILRVIAEDPKINVPILLHASHMIAMTPRIAWPPLAKICRLCGADLMLTPSYWSSIPMVSLEEGLRTAQVKTAPFFHIKKTWPMPAAGMYPGLLPTLVREYGNDMVIPAGGGMLGHPRGYTAGAKAWRQAIDAVMDGIPLEKAAKTKPELKAAIDYWGVLKRPRTPWLRASPRYHPKSTQEE
jgi:2,3-diketo-5-methylthiopentyl-1-phosphate enolase